MQQSQSQLKMPLLKNFQRIPKKVQKILLIAKSAQSITLSIAPHRSARRTVTISDNH